MAEAHSYKKRANLVSRHVAGQTLVVPVSENAADLDSVYVFNPVGARIWELLDSKSSVPDIADSIQREFQVAEAEATHDVSEFLASLGEMGLAQRL